MDKFRYYILGVIVLEVAPVYVFLVKVQKPGLDIRISVEKQNDSLLHFAGGINYIEIFYEKTIYKFCFNCRNTIIS